MLNYNYKDLSKERDDLKWKIKDYNLFLSGEMIQYIAGVQLTLIKSQVMIMEAYLNIVETRISLIDAGIDSSESQSKLTL